jgi:hypothetical protein
MAQKRVRPTGEERRGLRAEWSVGVMSDQVDTWVPDDQPAILDASIDRPPIDSGLAQLMARNTATLLVGDCPDPPIN